MGTIPFCLLKPGSPAVLLPWHKAHEHFRVHGRSPVFYRAPFKENLAKKNSTWHIQTEKNSLAGMGRKSHL